MERFLPVVPLFLFALAAFHLLVTRTPHRARSPATCRHGRAVSDKRPCRACELEQTY